MPSSFVLDSVLLFFLVNKFLFMFHFCFCLVFLVNCAHFVFNLGCVLLPIRSKSLGKFWHFQNLTFVPLLKLWLHGHPICMKIWFPYHWLAYHDQIASWIHRPAISMFLPTYPLKSVWIYFFEHESESNEKTTEMKTKKKERTNKMEKEPKMKRKAIK